MGDHDRAEVAEYATTARRPDHDREPSTALAVRALAEANERIDKIVGVLHDKLDAVLLETAPEDRGDLIAAVRQEQSRLGAQVFGQVDVLHQTASRLERLVARIDL